MYPDNITAAERVDYDELNAAAEAFQTNKRNGLSPTQAELDRYRAANDRVLEHQRRRRERP